MLELFTLFNIINANEGFQTKMMQDSSINNESISNTSSDSVMLSSIPTSWIIIALIISFGTAYIAFSCNEFEKPATRALSTIIAFFFSGFYLIYYFIVHVLFDRKWMNPILFGAGVYSHPIDCPELFIKYPNIKKILVPGQWMKKMFEPYYGNSVVSWPVGIDTEKVLAASFTG